jgi:hypothetical protein
LFSSTTMGSSSAANTGLYEHRPRLGCEITSTFGYSAARNARESSVEPLSITTTRQSCRDAAAARTSDGRHSANSRRPL